MARMYYYIPKDQLTVTHVNDKELEAEDALDAIDKIKDIEDIKRIPPTWKIFIEKTPGEFLEVNRRSISRLRQEKKHKERWAKFSGIR